MWVDRKQYENTMDLLEETIEKNTKLEKELQELKSESKRKTDTNINLERQVSSLIDTNKKLNDWIEKILYEVGIQELHERTGVTIPVYTENPIRLNPDQKFDNEGFLRRREIIIPELRFVKMG